MKTVSVVIPVYNVEKYLPECLDSVINQTYKNLQIILVDDGSTDSSGKICDEYAEKDNRITVVHQKNAGAGAAKNTALKIADGKYLAFVDSDDFLELDAFEHMVSILAKNSADIVQCCYRDVFVNKKIDAIKDKDSFGSYTTDDYLKRYTTDWSCGLLWDKLYLRKLFDGIYFEEGHVVDDEYFTYQGVMNAKKIIIDSQIIYNYRKRISSVSYIPEHMERIIFDRLDYLSKRRIKVIKRFPYLKETFNRHYVNMLIWLSDDPYLTNESLDEIKKQMKIFLKNTNNKGINFKTRLVMMHTIYGNNSKLLNKKRKISEEKSLIDYFD